VTILHHGGPNAPQNFVVWADMRQKTAAEVNNPDGACSKAVTVRTDFDAESATAMAVRSALPEVGPLYSCVESS
jgi:hypothetical protein